MPRRSFILQSEPGAAAVERPPARPRNARDGGAGGGDDGFGLGQGGGRTGLGGHRDGGRPAPSCGVLLHRAPPAGRPVPTEPPPRWPVAAMGPLPKEPPRPGCLGPAYASKMNRNGLRFCDLVGPDDVLVERLGALRAFQHAHYRGCVPPTLEDDDDELGRLRRFRDRLVSKNVVRDTVTLLRDRIAANRTILAEGANAALLEFAGEGAGTWAEAFDQNAWKLAHVAQHGLAEPEKECETEFGGDGDGPMPMPA